jgi:hypothetical protein
MLGPELTSERAPWYPGPGAFAAETIGSALQSFSAAFDRWRDLYRATTRQIDVNRRIMDSHTATTQERGSAKQRHDEAFRQRQLLLAGTESLSSDFYTYRYLASEAFLPGYNFPRLPLMAYVPGTRDARSRDAYLTRPRFLALGEFGPRSLVYHEGRAFRVVRAMLTITGADRVREGAELPTEIARICDACGYGHFADQRDVSRCVACNASLAEADGIRALYRIENVATVQALRITANDEDRQRQGFEMQTTWQWAVRGGSMDRREVKVVDAEGAILTLQYGPSATVWRINKGLRRRANPQVYGFNIHPITGYWAKESDDDDTQEPQSPDQVRSQRIVPYVQDRRNVLLLRPQGESWPEKTITTLQYALKRGTEAVFQIEESELLAESLPTPANRHGVLFYEAAEGGAGVLTRLVHEPDALARVAREALALMHYKRPENSIWQHVELESVPISDHQPACEAGCYRCLLSYFNQPDQPLIDRKDPLATEILVRLTRSRTELTSRMLATSAAKADGVAGEWLEWLDARKLRRPDKADHALPSGQTAAFWYEDWQAAVFFGLPEHDRKSAENAGAMVVDFSQDKARWDDVLAQHADLFDIGASK